MQAFKKDFDSEWVQHVQKHSLRISDFTMGSLMQRFATSRTIGGDNMRHCETCGKKKS